MSTITTISKATHVVTYELSDNLISLNENSVVVIDRSKDDVVKITRNGNSAEIIFKNGDVIIIENYFYLAEYMEGMINKDKFISSVIKSICAI